ncbi:MAG: hypothetical protein DYG83_02840 [Candidatus Brocadia sp. AMX2]|nr:MAG: hypothetical protein EDM70_17330 [Candidatus Brocadia sp. AMX2]KXK30332.1 MAG: hypothetical protein UZ01_01472 [Candidatus Brocadia sinica]MBC6931088.1 hypothetical protein [Candidatus Brocadia sp.]MBL1168135.1 hypothetical protein [Candidatus Brocadia sp. AMX1]MCE7865763.1 hypothetical protein [Candidatus Brocadia sp. AMX2]
MCKFAITHPQPPLSRGEIKDVAESAQIKSCRLNYTQRWNYAKCCGSIEDQQRENQWFEKNRKYTPLDPLFLEGK